MRRWEKEWWEGIATECKDAEDVGDIGGLYRGLRKIGLKDVKKAPVETKLTTVEFRNHFSNVSKDRFEEDPAVLEAAVHKGL